MKNTEEYSWSRQKKKRKKKKDKTERAMGAGRKLKKTKKGDSKVESNDSPETVKKEQYICMF